MNNENQPEITQPDSITAAENVDQDSGVSHQVNENENVEDAEIEYSKNVKKRIDKLSSKLSAKDQEIQYLKQQLEAKQSQPTFQHEKEQSAPKMADFDSVEQFTDAMTEFKLNKKLQEQAMRQQSEAKYNSYKQRVDDFVKTTPDFAIAVGEIDPVVSRDPDVMELIIDSEVGPQIAYHLANHEDLLNSIMNMSKSKRLAALGKIELELQNKGKFTPKQESKLEPTVRVSGKSSTSTSKNSGPPQDYSEWVKWRKANKSK